MVFSNSLRRPFRGAALSAAFAFALIAPAFADEEATPSASENVAGNQTGNPAEALNEGEVVETFSTPFGVEEATQTPWEETAPTTVGLTIPEAINQGRQWKITKERWSEEDELGYSAFIQAIGWSDCTSLDDCLASEANPYRDTDTTRFSGDCADMAYMLRAYYAWKNALPFSYQAEMRTADGKAEDPRYSTGGNIVVRRRSALGSSPVSGNAFIRRIPGEVSTAMFRTHPATGGGRSFDDFYPIAIGRDTVRPGVIAYDIYGHVGIVYDILEDGRVLVIASHPDHSVTRTTYGANFLRAKPELGAGLKAWRPIYVENAKKAEDGRLIGGRIKAVSNDELPDFSIEQYFGNRPHPSGEWHSGEFHVNGRTVNYYDYVRRRLAAPNFAYNPVDELRFGLESVCGAIRARKAAVDKASAVRVHLREHPKRLPDNIYGTYGDWETYSTPSRDARLKVAIIELRREMQDLVKRHREGDPSVAYDGEDLGTDLWNTFVKEKDQCTFTYWRSDNSRIRLNMAHVIERLWDLSFDPYHCPERRWGARGNELATCTDDEIKTRWYNAQRFLRNQAKRTYDIRMGFTLNELQSPAVASPRAGGLGVEEPADADLKGYLASLRALPALALFPEEGTLVSETEAEPEPNFAEWHYSKVLNRWGPSLPARQPSDEQ